MSRRIRVDEDGAGRRLDVVVAESARVSRSRAGELVAAGAVSVDGRVERKSYRVAAGDVIEVAEPEHTPPPAAPEGVRILFEDDDVLVVDKPPGVVVHAAPGLREGTLVDALRARGYSLAPAAGEDRPGIVHRLDRDVSGVLVVARNDAAYAALTAAMSNREIERTYVALVTGVPSVDRGKIDAPVGRDPRHPTRMAVLPEGRPSVTWFSVTERFGMERSDSARMERSDSLRMDASLLEVRLETGRTHQIRAHLAAIGHPVVGDSAYGRDPSLARELGLGRIFLHARKLEFAHPVTGMRLETVSELPDDLSRALDALRGR